MFKINNYCKNSKLIFIIIIKNITGLQCYLLIIIIINLPLINTTKKFQDEILLIILKNLDLNSLIKLGTVNNRFNELTQDPSLYNTFNVCMRHDETSSIDNAEIENRVLSHFPFSKNLYLTYSPFVDDVLVKKISQCSRLRRKWLILLKILKSPL